MDRLNSILFVCMGNICRSPLAQGVFQSVVNLHGLEDQFYLDSAGTGSWHVGNPPDPRGQQVAADHGLDISNQRCRQIQMEDFSRFRLILAMDRVNVRNIRNLLSSDELPEIALFMEHAGLGPVEVPDPYYGGDSGFEEVFQMLLEGSRLLLSKCR